MTSFRSNLNSVSSTYEGLTAIKNRITTCFKHWRRKLVRPNKEIVVKKKNLKCKNPEKRGLCFNWCQSNGKEFHLLQKTNENLRTLNEKFTKIISRKFYFLEKTKSKNLKTQKVEIFAKFISSTLIGSQINLNSFGNITSIRTHKAAAVEAPTNMTIADDTFQLIRKEYPDLDAEVRGILMARAQTGATIGEIREDYRKHMGVPFPVYDNVTDFLLCIPGVTAYCSESGTRIFNVKPTESTKHLHNLVMHQKAPSERSGTTDFSNYRHKRRQANGINAYRSAVVPLSWRCDYNHYYQPLDCGIHRATTMNGDLTRNPQLQPQSQNPPHLQSLQQHSNIVEEGSATQSNSDVFGDNRNGYYQDNCQYLLNRIYNNYDTNKAASCNSHESCQNRNEISTQLNPQNLVLQSSSNSHPINHNNVDNDLFKQPKLLSVRKTAIHASSPCGTRTTTTDSMSIFSSECNYDAHLLDFPLLGDDFFLYLARMELKCKFKKNERVLQSGLCISGQTIKAATKRVSRLAYNAFANRRIIINIGSVDIMQGKTLVQIEHDFRNLINVVNRRGLLPILTTLAPLANYAHDSSVKTKLERFNEFIKREGQYLLVIDVWSSFVNERRQTLFDCYQNEPRQVTGANESYVFWNKIGRQRVLQLVESELEY